MRWNDDYSSKWEEEMTDYTAEDLDDEALKDFYRSARDCGRLALKTYDKEKLLTAIGIIHDGQINNGGYALLGKNAKIGLKAGFYSLILREG